MAGVARCQPGVRAAAAVMVSLTSLRRVSGPGPAEPRPPCLVAPPLGQSPASHGRLGSVAATVAQV